TATAAFFDIFLGQGIGNLASFKAGAFVLDDNFGLRRGDGGLNVHLLVWIKAVAVLDRVGQRFFQGQFDRERRLGAVSMSGDALEDGLLDFTAGRVFGGDGGANVDLRGW